MQINKSCPLVAVIVPAYNAQSYIESSMRSILRQSYENFRLIVVNDGSTDTTEEILFRLAAEDSRLEVITVPNGGPANARNIALDRVARGADYIMFSDADDEMPVDAIEYAVGNIRDADIALLGFSIRNPDGSERLYCEREQHLTQDSIGAELGGLYKANLLNQVWAKLFRCALIQDSNIRFLNYRWGEDRLFIYDCLEKSTTIAVLPEAKYIYIMHPGESLITKYIADKPEVCKLSDRRMMQLCERFNVTDERDFRYMFMKSIFSCMTTLYSPSCKLSHAEKHSAVREIIYDEQVQSRSHELFGGLAIKLLCGVIHTKNVALNCLVFRFVAFAGKAAPRLFTMLKHKK